MKMQKAYKINKKNKKNSQNLKKDFNYFLLEAMTVISKNVKQIYQGFLIDISIILTIMYYLYITQISCKYHLLTDQITDQNQLI